MNKKSTFKAFTMAEVLITLMILGVIATVTIPAMVKNIEKKDTITKLQKAYKILSQAGLNIRVNSNSNDITDSGLTDFENYHKSIGLHQEFSKLANMNTKEITKDYILTSDGFTYAIIPSKQWNYNLLEIWVNIDYGKGKKSEKGRNTFCFIMYDNFRVEPLVYGFGGSEWPLSAALQNKHHYVNKDSIDTYCNKNDNSSWAKNTCAAKIMKDGWKIADDYPW